MPEGHRVFPIQSRAGVGAWMTASTLLILACRPATPHRSPPREGPAATAKTSTRAELRGACDLGMIATSTHTITSDPGIRILITRSSARGPRRGAVVLMHGAGSPSSSIWDLHHDDYSMMRRLSCEGFDAYGVDVRGYGGSSRPPVDDTGEPGPVRAKDAVRDLRAAVRWAKETSQVDAVDVIGWSWGCVVSGMYAGLEPENVRRLVLFAPVYDREWKTRHATAHRWRPLQPDVFAKYHDPDRESRAVLDLHVAQLFAYADRDGVLRVSNGPYFDIYGEDGPIWDPREVLAPTLVLRGEDDRASQEGPAYRLFTHLERAADRRYVVLSDAGHFAFRTYRYRAFQDEVLHFLTSTAIGAGPD